MSCTSLADRFRRHELAVVALLSLVILLAGLWSFQLIDPWETHYSEVGRRILEDDDWVHLKWQNEIFRSKPVLTFWLIAGSMKAMGVATDGGYSGELVVSDLAVFAARLPFALFGAFGLVMVWWMLARLVNRRVAWIAYGITLTCPIYMVVSRQAITDMPMVASLMGAVALFAMHVHRGSEPLRPFWKKFNAHHVFVACFGLFVLLQAAYYILYFHYSPALARGLRLPQPGWVLGGGMIAVLGGLVAWMVVQPVTTRGAVWLHWAFVLVGLAVLAKGPVIALVFAIAGFYIVLTARWRLMLDWEWLRGLVVGALVTFPWHVAMFFKDGQAWINEYIDYHMGKRLAEGAHGDRGTFDYFSSIFGVGMWPWAVLIPAALVGILWTANNRSREGQVRLLCGIWAIVGFALFAFSQTKFHHYILPVVPALAILVAFWIDDALAGRAGRVTLFALFAAALSLLVTRDLLGEPKQIIELFIYRYDRPWPSGKPWHLDISDAVFFFGVLGAAALVAVAVPARRVRPWALGALGVVALLHAVWTANEYMQQAAPHWGQRELHRKYLATRTIHGLEIKYWSLRDLADEWEGTPADDEVRVESVLPDGFRTGLPMTIRLLVPGAGVAGDKVELAGSVSRIGDDEFWIKVPAAERGKLKDLIARGKKYARGRKPWRQVDADRLVAWQLNWRGENFWSAGEIWGETPDTHTVFINTNNEEFLKYVKEPSRAGRTFYVITEAPRANGLKNVLPTKRGKQTVEILDTSCNKFTLLRFTL